MMNTQSGTQEREAFGPRFLLAAVQAWMEVHPTAADLVTRVEVSGDATGHDVHLSVTGDTDELRLLAGTFGLDLEADEIMPMRDASSDAYGRKRRWRQGSFMITRADGQHWAVTVTRELSVGAVDTGTMFSEVRHG